MLTHKGVFVHVPVTSSFTRANLIPSRSLGFLWPSDVTLTTTQQLTQHVTKPVHVHVCTRYHSHMCIYYMYYMLYVVLLATCWIQYDWPLYWGNTLHSTAFTCRRYLLMLPVPRAWSKGEACTVHRGCLQWSSGCCQTWHYTLKWWLWNCWFRPQSWPRPHIVPTAGNSLHRQICLYQMYMNQIW